MLQIGRDCYIIFEMLKPRVKTKLVSEVKVLGKPKGEGSDSRTRGGIEREQHSDQERKQKETTNEPEEEAKDRTRNWDPPPHNPSLELRTLTTSAHTPRACFRMRGVRIGESILEPNKGSKGEEKTEKVVAGGPKP